MTRIVFGTPLIMLVMLSGISLFFGPIGTYASSNLEQIPSVTTDFPGNNQAAVEVQVTVAKKDSLGDYHVKGSIKNLSPETLQFVQVTGYFLDNNNKTVGVTSCCYADPTDIESGHTGTFDSFVQKDDLADTPTAFRLGFDWQ